MREAEAAPASAKAPAALEAARSLARLDTEKAALDDLVRRRAAALQAEQGRREKELSPRLDEIAGAVDRIEAQLKAAGPGQADDRAILGSIADSQRVLWRTSRRTSRSPARALQDRARTLSDRLDAVRIADGPAQPAGPAGGRDHRGRRLFARGRRLQPRRLASALQAFAKAFPDSPRSRAFATTIHDQPVWDAIGEWDRLTAGWQDGRAAVAPQEANVRAEQCRQFLVQHPASPDFERATAYRHAMEAMSHRVGRRRGRARQAPEADDRPPGRQPVDGHACGPRPPSGPGTTT